MNGNTNGADSLRTASTDSEAAVASNSRASANSVVSKSSRNSTAAQHHVDYILVAEFSIDKGPVMEHQYPHAFSGDEHTLAELMLPDGAHERDQDWTVFFLHKNSEQSSEAVVPGGQTPLTYVLNLVITKHDKEAKRGAKVKAMAICTKHSFLHIYKPILLLALEEYFKHPEVGTLAGLYTAVNSMDLSSIPHLSVFEKRILAESDKKDMFLEKFEETQGRGASLPARSPSSLGNALTDSDRENRGLTYIDLAPGRPPGQNKVVNGRIIVNRDSHEFETKVVYNQVPVPIRVPVAVLPETVGDFSIIQLITTFSSQPQQPFPTHPHLTTNGPLTHPIIVLVNALLTEKRVVFLSHERSSGEVGNHVLAACALASGGVLRGFTRFAFPYTDLSKVKELLEVGGFIAGVKNPTFANHPDWWDVLCDIDSGRIQISSKIEQPTPSDGASMFGSIYSGASDTMDNAFMEGVMSCIAARYGEKTVRARWREWIVSFTQKAAAFEEMVYGISALWVGHEENHVIRGHGSVWRDEQSKMRDLAANMPRIEGWRGTRSYIAYVQDVHQLHMAKPIKVMDVRHQVDRLRHLTLTHEEAGRIYQALKEYVDGYEEINQLLCAIPENLGGLSTIAYGLFHPQQKVRFAVVELIDRVRVHMAGRHFYDSLNRFLKLAFIRLRQEKTNTTESPVAANGLTMAGLSLGATTQ